MLLFTRMKLEESFPGICKLELQLITSLWTKMLLLCGRDFVSTIFRFLVLHLVRKQRVYEPMNRSLCFCGTNYVKGFNQMLVYS